MVLLGFLAGPGNQAAQAVTVSVFSVFTALYTIIAQPYNSFGQNMNEIRAACLKPSIFILAALAAICPPELNGIIGTGMVII